MSDWITDYGQALLARTAGKVPRADQLVAELTRAYFAPQRPRRSVAFQAGMTMALMGRALAGQMGRAVALPTACAWPAGCPEHDAYGAGLDAARAVWGRYVYCSDLMKQVLEDQCDDRGVWLACLEILQTPASGEALVGRPKAKPAAPGGQP